MARVIREYMTIVTQRIAPTATLAEAHRQMRNHQIRHLPVVEDGKLVGVLSLGDLHLLETLKDVDPRGVTVEEAMTPAPYTVWPDVPLEVVARYLAEHKLGSALVVEGGEVVGIFTANDALRTLADILGRAGRQQERRA